VKGLNWRNSNSINTTSSSSVSRHLHIAEAAAENLFRDWQAFL